MGQKTDTDPEKMPDETYQEPDNGNTDRPGGSDMGGRPVLLDEDDDLDEDIEVGEYEEYDSGDDDDFEDFDDGFEDLEDGFKDFDDGFEGFDDGLKGFDDCFKEFAEDHSFAETGGGSGAEESDADSFIDESDAAGEIVEDGDHEVSGDDEDLGKGEDLGKDSGAGKEDAAGEIVEDGGHEASGKDEDLDEEEDLGKDEDLDEENDLEEGDVPDEDEDIEEDDDFDEEDDIDEHDESDGYDEEDESDEYDEDDDSEEEGSLGLNLFTIFVMLIAAAITAVYFTCNVKTVRVTGTSLYTSREIAEQVIVDDTQLMHNSVFLTVLYMTPWAPEIPFVESVRVSLDSPDSITITVKDMDIAGYIPYAGKNLYFSADGIVLENSPLTIRNAAFVTGLTITKGEIGSRMEAENAAGLDLVLNALEILKKYELHTESIYLGKTGGVTMYLDQIKVQLGRTDFELKISKIAQIYPYLEGRSGTINMTNYSSSDENIILK